VDQFSVIYDLYLEILYRVDKRVNQELGRTTDNWRLLNSCPPCMYELEDEPSLPFSFMCEMDGNNSLKRTSGIVRDVVERPDVRGQRTDYWLQPSEVDVFKDEVKSVGLQVFLLLILTIVVKKRQRDLGRRY
jgi:hypothetical protein